MQKSFYVAVAQSDEPESPDVAQHLMNECLRQLAGKTPNAAILFTGIDVPYQDILDAIVGRWAGIHLVGCTTDGEFSSRKGFMQDSALLVLLGSDTVEFASGVIDLGGNVETECLSSLKKSLEHTARAPAAGILFADGMSLMGESAVDGLSKALGHRTPIFGGMAADKWRLQETRQFYGTRSLTHSAPFLIFCGSFSYSFGVETGWRSVGETGVVTQALKNVVYEINDKPALTFYRELLGEEAVPYREMPVAVYDREDRFCFLRASFQNFDPETGAVTYLGSIPEGCRVRLTVVDRESIINGSQASAEKAQAGFPQGSEPSVALCFSCAARRVILGTRTADECRVVQQALGDGVPVAGFYTYGEIAPTSVDLSTQFHNETFVTLLLG